MQFIKHWFQSAWSLHVSTKWQRKLRFYPFRGHREDVALECVKIIDLWQQNTGAINDRAFYHGCIFAFLIKQKNNFFKGKLYCSKIAKFIVKKKRTCILKSSFYTFQDEKKLYSDCYTNHQYLKRAKEKGKKKKILSFFYTVFIQCQVFYWYNIIIKDVDE